MEISFTKYIQPRPLSNFNRISFLISINGELPSKIPKNLIPLEAHKLPSRVVTLLQIHSPVVHTITHEADINRINFLPGDGLITTIPDLALVVRVADCAPVLIFEPSGKVIALLHAGWRGIMRGILETAVEKLVLIGYAPKNLVSYIGPAIGEENYEVGNEFLNWFPRSAKVINGKVHFDIKGEIKLRLQKLGIKIAGTFPYSTYSTPWLSSYRRDGKSCGRTICIAWIKQDTQK